MGPYAGRTAPGGGGGGAEARGPSFFWQNEDFFQHNNDRFNLILGIPHPILEI